MFLFLFKFRYYKWARCGFEKCLESDKHVLSYDSMLRGVKVWTKCSKKQKSLKLINVRPLFGDY